MTPNILQEADQLLSKDRQADYGDPQKMVADILEVYEALTGTRPLSPSQFYMLMVAMKLARNKHRFKRDNLVDAVAYLDLYNRALTDFIDKDFTAPVGSRPSPFENFLTTGEPIYADGTK